MRTPLMVGAVGAVWHVEVSIQSIGGPPSERGGALRPESHDGRIPASSGFSVGTACA